MKTEKNMRKGFGLAGKIAVFCIGLVSLVLTSCESELEIQQSYPFTVETMPVPKELNRNETAEIRCELKSEGDFDGIILHYVTRRRTSLSLSRTTGET